MIARYLDAQGRQPLQVELCESTRASLRTERLPCAICDSFFGLFAGRDCECDAAVKSPITAVEVWAMKARCAAPGRVSLMSRPHSNHDVEK